MAKHLLAKVLLTRGWSSAAKPTDFTDAYNQAIDLINTKSQYGNGNGSLELELILRMCLEKGMSMAKKFFGWLIETLIQKEQKLRVWYW